ncbi:MAG TPA: thiamine phosphate synthase, partial [Thermodesulfovibrionales bacterium]|nr:thiamine phosphate synthase [Thermodesulfovibrionales bacterium]
MTRKVLAAGVRWVQYRDKTSSRRKAYEEAMKLRAVTREAHAALLINDYSDISIAVDAEGVHLGQDDLPLREARIILGKDKIIGISTHSIEQAVEAEQDGADYIAFGPVFQTATKDAGSPKGVEMLRTIKNRVGIPVIAIGGINLRNLSSVFET